MKGYNSDYGGGTGDGNGNPVNGDDFNRAGSSSVKEVDSVNIVANGHSVSMTGTSNSVTKVYKGDQLSSERYYGENGNAYLDIDYTNHGNAKTHLRVPHEHKIWLGKDGKFSRGKDEDIK